MEFIIEVCRLIAAMTYRRDKTARQPVFTAERRIASNNFFCIMSVGCLKVLANYEDRRAAPQAYTDTGELRVLVAAIDLDDV